MSTARLLITAVILLMAATIVPAQQVLKGGGSPAPLSCDGTNCTVTSGQLRLPNGVVGTPSASWTNDTGTGWYRAGSGQIGYAMASSTPFFGFQNSDKTLYIGNDGVTTFGTIRFNNYGSALFGSYTSQIYQDSANHLSLSSGLVGIGGTVNLAAAVQFDGTGNVGPTVDGAFYLGEDAAQGNPTARIGQLLMFTGNPSYFNGVLTNTAAYAAIANVAVKTYFAVGAEGKLPIGPTAAHKLLNAARHRVECDFAGVFSTTGAPTMQLGLDWCQVSGCATGTVITHGNTEVVTMPTGVTNKGWNMKTWTNVFISGTTGVANEDTQGEAVWDTGTGTASIGLIKPTAVVSADTTVDEYVSPWVTWGTANASNTITLRNLGCRVF